MIKKCIVFIGLLLMVGCAANLENVSENILNTTAFNIGAIGYGFIPETRAPLNIICSMNVNDNSTIKDLFNDNIGKVWITASNSDNLKSKLIIANINNIIGTIELKPIEQQLAAIKSVVIQICSGVNTVKETL